METVVVHRCSDDIEAELIRDLLAQEGIPCQVASNVPHTVLPFTTDGLGEVRISVHVGHAEHARQLILTLLADGEIVRDGEPLSEGE
ncbi:MAG: DUF2007 domain-containing protein [Candidatus Eisenbacteria bacterium]|jgi:hypothetical protein|nr:DUF2007 domain-containing protein [Candidatus Eisenbacteria bacterium]